MQLVVACGLAAVLAASALFKLAAPRSSRAALATFGIPDGRARTLVWASLVGLELALATGVALRHALAAYMAAALLVAFAVALAAAIRGGRAGAPCACFGARSRVSWRAIARNVALAGGFAALPFVPDTALTTEAWLALGLAVALVGVATLAVATLALAREVGLLRLQLAPQAALEIPDEGPPLGERSPLIERIAAGEDTRFALAVFTSDGCRLCRALEPGIASLGRDPLVALAIFDELRDAEAWASAAVPGSPYAIALDQRGVVLAKGTFNSVAQLEGILAAAERRSAERLYV